MIKSGTIIQYKDSFGTHYGIVEKDKGTKVHVWELSKNKSGWVKTLMNRDINKNDIIDDNINKSKFSKIVGENKMKKSELRQIIREEIQKLNEGSTYLVFNAETRQDFKKFLKGLEKLSYTPNDYDERNFWVSIEEDNPDALERDLYKKLINKQNINGYFELQD